jgi:glutamine synthetase
MIRIPDDDRIEFRLADGAANPYLLMAGILAAGLDGIEENIDPGKRLDIDMYTESHKVKNARQLPLNQLDAMRNFSKNKTIQAALGEEFSSAYIKLKHAEWNSYMQHLTQWERDASLDC